MQSPDDDQTSRLPCQPCNTQPRSQQELQDMFLGPSLHLPSELQGALDARNAQQRKFVQAMQSRAAPQATHPMSWASGCDSALYTAYPPSQTGLHHASAGLTINNVAPQYADYNDPVAQNAYSYTGEPSYNEMGHISPHIPHGTNPNGGLLPHQQGNFHPQPPATEVPLPLHLESSPLQQHNTFLPAAAEPNFGNNPQLSSDVLRAATVDAATENAIQDVCSRYKNIIPAWMQPQLVSPTPASAPQPSGSIDITDTPPKDNYQLGCDHDSPLEVVQEQLKGYQPTQLDVMNTPSPDCSPDKQVARQWGEDVYDEQKPLRKRKCAVGPGPSIDVDNEENNFWGGVNRRVHDHAIDLSDETNHEMRSRLKKRPGQKSCIPEDETAFRIPKTGSRNEGIGYDALRPDQSRTTNGSNPTPFHDPLRQTPHKPLGPPPRAFSKPEGATPPSRRCSPRLLGKTRRANTTSPLSTANRGSPGLANRSRRASPTTSPLNTTDCVPSEVSPDHQLPLGGLPKDKRERRTDGNSYMNSNRYISKRRRPNGVEQTNLPLREPDTLRNAENRPVLEKRRTKRRTRQDGTGKPKNKKSSVGNASKALVADKDTGNEFSYAKRQGNTFLSDKSKKGKSAGDNATRELFADENSDSGLSCAFRDRKPFAPGSQGIQSEQPGDSPLSNTVGDASNSDIDDIYAGGNELSSDDDSAPPPTQSSRASRRHRSKVPKQTLVNKSPRASTRSKMTRVESVKDSDDENFMGTGQSSVEKRSKESIRTKSSYKKSKEALTTPSSPINLVSPTSSQPNEKPVRRSPRNAKKAVSGEKKAGQVSQDESDEDFDDTPMNTRVRSRTKRGITGGDKVVRTERRQNSSRRQGTVQSNIKQKELESKNAERVPSDGDADYRGDESGNEDTDAAAVFPSQEQGSQPIDLDIKLVKKRKKANPKVFPEREFKKLSPDELAIIRVAFIKRYPTPPSNMQAQGRYEAAHGTEMTTGMVQRTWETQLKPWSDRWWQLYLDFNQTVREKKLGKPRDKDPTIKEKEVKSWLEKYYQEHGDARPSPQATDGNDKAQ